jgi:hypothetical protein
MHYGSNALTNENENHSQEHWGTLTPLQMRVILKSI